MLFALVTKLNVWSTSKTIRLFLCKNSVNDLIGSLKSWTSKVSVESRIMTYNDNFCSIIVFFIVYLLLKI